MPARKLFHDSVIEIPSEARVAPSGVNVQAATSDHHDEVMTVSFSLSPDDGLNEELESRVEKGDRIPIEEIRQKYGVKENQVSPLLAWLKANHFDIRYQAADNTSIQASATASDIAKALQVELVRVTNDGITFTAARNAPSLPDEISENVRAIIGLQPYRTANKHSRRLPMRQARKAPNGSPHASALRGPGYLPVDVLRAYNADGIGVKGEGQTIGIVIDAAPSAKDLAAFWSHSGIENDPTRVEIINLGATVLPPPSGEETLDAEWASGVAPGAKIRIYATGSLSFADIDFALDRILLDVGQIPGLRQVSMSLGLGEEYMAPGEIKTEHAKFLRLAAAGVNVFVSSGDAGSNPDSTGHGSAGPLQAEYECSDPCVVGVGGTTLKIGVDGTIQETAWSGSGGGKSIFFPRPAWQAINGSDSGKNRMVPDVSLTADPNYGAHVVLHGNAMEYGGTSWSAPVWAGFCALLNSAREKAGKPALGFLNPLLYPKHGTDCYRDIMDGGNGAYDALTGYDMVTGLGTPDVMRLAQALA